MTGIRVHNSPTREPRLSNQPHRQQQRSRLGTVLGLSTAAVAAAALFNTYRARKVEREHPPKGRFVTVDGVRLHYLDQGEGSPVILIHGNVVDAGDWVLSGVFDRTAAHHRVIAFDRPGFGHSGRPHGSMWTAAHQATLLRHAFRELGIERPVVVGHSWGALVALELALNHPDAVRGLVVLSGYYDVTVRYDVPLVAVSTVPGVGDVIRYTVSPVLGAALLPLNIKAMFSPQPVPPQFKRNFPYGFPIRPWQIRAESQDAVTMMPAAIDMHQRFRHLRLPVFILAGTEDRIVSHESHATWLHDQIPGSRLQLINGAGHMVHYVRPQQVAACINEVAAARHPTEKVSADDGVVNYP